MNNYEYISKLMNGREVMQPTQTVQVYLFIRWCPFNLNCYLTIYMNLKKSINNIIALFKIQICFRPGKVLGGCTAVSVDQDSVNRCCTRKVLYKRLPILQWLPKYTVGEHGISDLVAGITVGLTVIPQAIAFANVAGLPPQVSRSRPRIFANR